MNSEQGYIYTYRASLTKGSGVIFTVLQVIAFISVFVPLMFCGVLAALEGGGYWLAAGALLLLSVLFGPLGLVLRRYPFAGVKEDGAVELKSMLNLIPKSYTLRASDIASVEMDNPLRSFGVVFKDGSGKRLATFNDVGMGGDQRRGLYDALKRVNPDIRLP